jgi:hypothetical protein
VIIPHGSRLGGEEIADFRSVDIEYELRAAVVTAWSLANSAAGACAENRELCDAASRLWATTLDTAGEIISKASKVEADAAQPMETASNSRKPDREN